MNERWQDWTPCEMYGHLYTEDSTTCRDCGIERTDDE